VRDGTAAPPPRSPRPRKAEPEESLRDGLARILERETLDPRVRGWILALLADEQRDDAK